MCGCCNAAVVLISCTNRSAPNTAASSGLQHLERDLAIVLEVLAQVHGGHAAFTEMAKDAIAAGEGRVEAVSLLGHACLWTGGRPTRFMIAW